MHFGHSDIVLALIVCEGDDGIGHKSQHILFIKLQPFQQIAGFTSFNPPALSGVFYLVSDILFLLVATMSDNAPYTVWPVLKEVRRLAL